MSHLKRAAQVAAIALLAGCTADSAGPLAPAAPRLTIEDAAHGGAVPGFYFLPPMVSAPAYSGTFDAALSPRVEICQLVGTACGAVIATYTMSSGTGGELVHLNPGDYSVLWKTAQFNLDPSKTYRISVFSDAFRLGFADVDVVSSGNQLKNVDTQQYIPLLDDRTLPIKFRIETGIAGAVAVAPDSASVEPGGTQQFTATVTDLHGNPLPGAPLTWSTGNNAIATVDGGGLATGVSPGTTSVTAVSGGASGNAILVVEIPNTPPTAAPDTFQAIGNVTVPVAAPGVLANDTDPELTPLSAVPGTIATANGGTVTLAADGSFTYLSASGYTGTDSFEYIVTDGSLADSGTVTVNVPTRVWYARNDAASPGDGRDASPYARLKDAETASAAGETVFVLYGDGTTAGYDEGFVYKPGQSLTGQGIPSSIITTLNGQNVTLLAAGSAPRLTRTTAGATIALATNDVLQGVHVASGAGAGIDGTSFGTFAATAVDVEAVGGPAANLHLGTAAASFGTLSSSGSAGAGAELVQVDGTVAAATGTISGAAGIGFHVNGGGAAVSYGGDISGSVVRAVVVTARGGSAVTFSGSINDAGGGILVAANSGGSMSFTGPAKVLSTGTNAGVNLHDNPGATITFAGGGLDVTTTTGTGFRAVDGGTVTLTGAGNQVSSVGGAAVHVEDATIGSAGLTFERVSATGGANGIVLVNTGALNGLQVTGDGATAGSGGTLQGMIGADGAVAGSGVYLSGVRNVWLRHMQLNDFANFAIRGANVDGFALVGTVVNGVNGTSAAADEGSIVFNGLTGAASITDAQISGGVEDNFRVVNSSGTLDRLVFTSSAIGPNGVVDGQDGVELVAQAGAVMKVTVQNSTFTSARASLFRMSLQGMAIGDLVLSGNGFSNNHPAIISGSGNVVVDGIGASQLTYQINGNTFRDALGSALAVTQNSGAPAFAGTISGNTVGLATLANSGSVQGSGMSLVTVGGGTHTVAVSGNQVRQYNNQGILLQLGDASLGGSGALNATVTGNTISNPGTAPIAKNGLHLNAGTVSGDSHQVCLAASGNTLLGSGSGGAAGTDIRLRQRMLTTVRLPGYAGANNDNLAVQAFVQAANGGTPTALAQNTVATGGGGYVGGAACPLP